MVRRCVSACRTFMTLSVVVVWACVLTGSVYAASANNPQNGAIGVEGKIPSNPPTTAATIATPRNNESFSTIPITVNGLCTSGLVVKLFANNVFVGSVQCTGGSYSIQVDLFSGRNDLVARQFDSLDQGGPDSNAVTVNFNDAQFNPFGGSLLTLTSNYAARGANPGQKLAWPVILSGGTSPYAVSVDWGDGKPSDLISTAFTGTVELSHVYDKAGIYKVVVKATDKNGLAAFLQLVATANGAVTSHGTGSSAAGSSTTTINHVLWLPAAASIPLIFISFWLGQRYELATLRKHLEERRNTD